ncbi:recombinase family protein [Paenibacillus glycanilyticus]|uniref:recombinase family protein n=1 Tax=Paenibacillus glycanilyticus TaxID=126569 RepID=UPI0020403A20|nr:recombinase family protein [Paenibacillus glycanilyticus]MCM3628816.1 recombinase family protein [Paenibacillus glycanilyticus]
MKKCTFYARCSTDTEMQTNSIINQVSGLVKYANDMKYTLSETGIFCRRNGQDESYQGYIDEGFSGVKSAKHRRAFQKMMKDAKAGYFDTILTKSISRFGRNLKEILVNIEKLKLLGVGVWFEDIKVNTMNEADNVKLQIFGSLAEEESRAKSDSVQWAKKEAARRGIWSGHRPFGYDYSTEKKGHLVINEEQARTIRDIFRLFVDEGFGLNKIAGYLTLNNHATQKGGLWEKKLLSNILSNEIYRGSVRLHRTRKKDIKTGQIERIPEKEQIIYHDEQLRVIDDETFEQAQHIKRERGGIFDTFVYDTVETTDELGNVSRKKVRTTANRNGTRYSSAHLFSNLIRCVNCGGMFRYKKANRKINGETVVAHHYYMCRNAEEYGSRKCEYRNTQVQSELLEWVISEIREHREDLEKHESYLNMLIEARFEKDDITERITQIDDTISELTQDESSLLRLLSKNIITDDEYGEQRTKIRDELSKLQSERLRLVNVDTEIGEIKRKYSQFIKYMQDIDLNNLTNVILRKIIRDIGVLTTYIPGVGDNQKIRVIEWNFIEWSQQEILDENVAVWLKKMNQMENDGFKF